MVQQDQRDLYEVHMVDEVREKHENEKIIVYVVEGHSIDSSCYVTMLIGNNFYRKEGDYVDDACQIEPNVR